MKREELFPMLMAKFQSIVEEKGLLERKVEIGCRALSAQEAIGETKRKDFPCLQARK